MSDNVSVSDVFAAFRQHSDDGTSWAKTTATTAPVRCSQRQGAARRITCYIIPKNAQKYRVDLHANFSMCRTWWLYTVPKQGIAQEIVIFSGVKD